MTALLMFEVGATSTRETRSRDTTRIPIRAMGQKSSQQEATGVRLQTIQFFLNRAQK